MIDVYRLLHPTARGYTHYTSRLGSDIKSRLDYIFVRGWPTSALQSCHITYSHPITHHRLIHSRITVTSSTKVFKGKRIPVQVPDLRNAVEEQKEALVLAVEEEFSKAHTWIRSKTAATRVDVEEVTYYLSSTAYTLARAELGLTGQQKWRHKSVQQLLVRRQSLISLLRLTQRLHKASSPSPHVFERCSEWKTKYDKYNRSSHAPPLTHAAVDYQQFIIDCTAEIRHVRKQIKLSKLRLTSQRLVTATAFDSNTTATVHRMMRDETPNELTSVVDAAGKQVTSPDQLKQVLHNGFATVFNLPAPTCTADVDDEKYKHPALMAIAATATPSGAPGWYNRIYKERRNTIQDEWYNGLMSVVDIEEVRAVCSACPPYAAPGHDGVSAGVWRLVAEKSDLVCEVLAMWMSACLRLRMMPTLGKKSIIVPIPKKPSKPMELSNIRPISLQAALTKLLSKLLSTRLANILAANPILHPAQEAFIKNGAISNCVDSWLDIWEVSKSKKSDCFNLFYDIKAAYDSVRHMDLLRSLHSTTRSLHRVSC
jgi:hypothetical protein